MFGGLDKKKCGLKPIALSVWEGWIFINLDPEPAMTLEEFLGDMAPYLSGLSYPYADTPVVLEVKVKCNWKVVMDAFAERSEEHTSELQSLMRISYAVFCLKKKKQHNKVAHI